MKVIPKLKLKNLRKELDVLHEKLTLYRILDRDRGKLPGSDDKVQEISDESEVPKQWDNQNSASESVNLPTNIKQELDMDIVEPMRVSTKS